MIAYHSGVAGDAKRVGRLRVLLVDDEPEMLQALTWELEEFADVTSCESVTRALELVRATKYDVVVADLRLPDRWGDELLAHVAARSPRTRRLLLTADSNPSRTVRELLETGVIDAAYEKRLAAGLVASIRAMPAESAG
jgi:response regulator RpfG family c-di-GMP phosphodiesterase